VVVGRAVNEAKGFDKESLNRSMKMTAPTMGLLELGTDSYTEVVPAPQGAGCGD
jgi:hypothetical protein